MKRLRLLVSVTVLATLSLFSGCCTRESRQTEAEAYSKTLPLKTDREVFSIRGQEGSLYDLVLFSNGTLLNNRDVRGTTGTWKLEDGQLFITWYNEEPTQVYQRTGLVLRPVRNADSALAAVSSPLAPFVGVWTAFSDTDQQRYWFALRSDGTARNTILPDDKGTWVIQDNRAVIHWESGWTNQIVPETGEMAFLSWRPGQSTQDPPYGHNVVIPPTELVHR